MSVFFNLIFVPKARADFFRVFFFVTRDSSAWAISLPVFFFICRKPRHYPLNYFFVRIEFHPVRSLFETSQLNFFPRPTFNGVHCFMAFSSHSLMVFSGTTPTKLLINFPFFNKTTIGIFSTPNF